jgi:hypothetical protein
VPCAYSGLNEAASNIRLQDAYELPKPSRVNIELQNSLQVQQSLINGIKRDIKTIKSPHVLESFLNILRQEETKLSRLQAESLQR